MQHFMHDRIVQIQLLLIRKLRTARRQTAGAKKGFVLVPRRWVVERSFGWVNRFRRLARDYERLPETLAGLHFFVFTILMLGNAASLIQNS
jgi:transposase